MSSLADEEWRFDRVNPEHYWACCVWEYCREKILQTPPAKRAKMHRQGRIATLGAVCEIDEFPAVPWLNLSAGVRGKLALRWRYSPAAIECYKALGYVSENTPEEWRNALRRVGCVVFDLGAPPRGVRIHGRSRDSDSGELPTRAELLTRFEAWLDVNPEWWEGRGRRGVRRGAAGKREPKDGLRALMWTRLRRLNRSDGDVEGVLRAGGAGKWMGAIGAERARKLPSIAEAWVKLVCEV